MFYYKSKDVARLGHGVGLILTDFMDGDPDINKMKSSEEMCLLKSRNVRL